MDHGDRSNGRLKGNTYALHTEHVSLAPLISLVNSDPGSGSRPDSEIVLADVETGLGSLNYSDCSDRSSTSSSNPSSGDFFQVIPNKIPKSSVSNGIPKPQSGTKPLFQNDKVDVSRETCHISEESMIVSRESVSQCSDITHESIFLHSSPTQSPAIQVMERSAGFEPGRIPTSIFSKPLSPMEWSVASNQSLFSIHIGNSSFRGSKRLKYFCRSGELLKSEEVKKWKQICQSQELLNTSDDQILADELIGIGQTSSAAAVEEVKSYENFDMTRVG